MERILSVIPLSGRYFLYVQVQNQWKLKEATAFHAIHGMSWRISGPPFVPFSAQALAGRIIRARTGMTTERSNSLLSLRREHGAWSECRASNCHWLHVCFWVRSGRVIDRSATGASERGGAEPCRSVGARKRRAVPRAPGKREMTWSMCTTLKDANRKAEDLTGHKMGETEQLHIREVVVPEGSRARRGNAGEKTDGNEFSALHPASGVQGRKSIRGGSEQPAGLWKWTCDWRPRNRAGFDGAAAAGGGAVTGAKNGRGGVPCRGNCTRLQQHPDDRARVCRDSVGGSASWSEIPCCCRNRSRWRKSWKWSNRWT